MMDINRLNHILSWPDFIDLARILKLSESDEKKLRDTVEKARGSESIITFRKEMNNWLETLGEILGFCGSMALFILLCAWATTHPTGQDELLNITVLSLAMIALGASITVYFLRKIAKHSLNVIFMSNLNKHHFNWIEWKNLWDDKEIGKFLDAVEKAGINYSHPSFDRFYEETKSLLHSIGENLRNLELSETATDEEVLEFRRKLHETYARVKHLGIFEKLGYYIPKEERAQYLLGHSEVDP
jgi:hypothetical protein